MASEDFHLSVTIIVQPFDAPLAGFVILEYFGRLWAVIGWLLLLRFVDHTRRRCDGPHRFLKRQWLFVGHCPVSDAVYDA